MVLLSLISVINTLAIKTSIDPTKKTQSDCVKLCVDAKPPVSNGMKYFLVTLSIVFLLVELFLLYFAVQVALKTKPGAERYVNIILAVTVTTPYLLLKTALNSRKMYVGDEMSPGGMGGGGGGLYMLGPSGATSEYYCAGKQYNQNGQEEPGGTICAINGEIMYDVNKGYCNRNCRNGATAKYDGAQVRKASNPESTVSDYVQNQIEQGAAAVARAGKAFVGPPQGAAGLKQRMFASGDNINHSQYIGTGFVDKNNEYGDYVMPDNYEYPMGSNRSANHNYMDMSDD